MENRKPYLSFVDLTGRKFGKLTVIKRVEDSVTRSGKNWSRGNVNVIAGISVRCAPQTLKAVILHPAGVIKGV